LTSAVPPRSPAYGTPEWLEAQYRESALDPWGLDWRPSQAARFTAMLGVLRSALARLPPRPRVLDFGCGTGDFTARLAGVVSEAGGDLLAVDVAPQAVARARDRVPGTRFEALTLPQCVAQEEGGFDLVTCLEVVYYVVPAEREAFLRDLARLLKPGGIALFSSRLGGPPYLSAAGLREEVGRALEVVGGGALCLSPLVQAERVMMGVARRARGTSRPPDGWIRALQRVFTPGRAAFSQRATRFLLRSRAASHAYVLGRKQAEAAVRPPRPRVRRMLVSTFFPSPADPKRAVFLLHLARALRRRGELAVTAPVPWAPLLGWLARWRHLGRRPADDQVEDLRVRRPRFLSLPGLEALSGLTYALSLWRRLRRPDVDRKALALHGHCAYPDGVGVALAASWLGLPFLLTAHGSDLNVYARKVLLRPQVRWALSRSRGVIAVSGPLLQTVRDLTATRTPPLAHVPCAGFEPEAFGHETRAQARQALDLPAAGRRVLFVGNLVPVKGADVLLEAWALRARAGALGPDDRLVVIGDGPERARLGRQAAALGLASSVSFVGPVLFEQVPRWMSASDVVCLPSRSEGTPNVMVEALASGVPVVATAVGGVPEVVRPGQNGLLVPPEDAAALAEALSAALGRAWIADELRRSVAHLTWDRLAAADEEFALRCLEEDRP
jgi:glycosyltransferase involved in cell wall biosynthesis/protein-L-isoaspartate O-methyltransferase